MFVALIVVAACASWLIAVLSGLWWLIAQTERSHDTFMVEFSRKRREFNAECHRHLELKKLRRDIWDHPERD